MVWVIGRVGGCGGGCGGRVEISSCKLAILTPLHPEASITPKLQTNLSLATAAPGSCGLGFRVEGWGRWLKV